jgi:preprotein translocase SecF subunit
MATEKEHESLQTELRGLDVGEAKKAGEADEPNHPYVDIAGLPGDSEKKEQIINLIQSLKLDAITEGPIARTSSFGTTVSGEMTRAAFISMLAAMLGIFIYLWFRFEFSAAWGVGAIAALIHDAMIAVGAVCFVNATGIFPVLIDLNLIAALLTIIGYSVNDTIVVFDRIREIKHQHPTRNINEVVNEAVNATLSRTILTSGTTLITLAALLLFGGPTIRDLSFTLFVGILVGTYSSIFIASPILVWWIGKYGAGRAPVPGGAEGQAKTKAAPQGAQI